MRTVAQGTLLGVGNRQLVFYHASRAGHMVDPHALAFEVFRTNDDATQLAPVSVFARTNVDLVAHKLGTGRFSAVGWTPAAGAGNAGKHFVRWYWTSEDGATEAYADTPIDVQAFAVDPGTPFYSSLSDVRAAGVTTSQASNAAVVAALRRASAFIERACGRFFEPRYLEQYHDGRGSTGLLFSDPIIMLDELKVTTRPVRPSDQPIDQDFIRVYNRHLSQGLRSPDDRNNPRIELFSMTEDWIGVRPFSWSRMVFPRAQQNVGVTGVFGYTDPDGSPFGRTPEDIDLAALLLMPRYVPAMRSDAVFAGRVKREQTRDQSYELHAPKDLGLPSNLTGDPEVDSILARFLRPPMFGGA